MPRKRPQPKKKANWSFLKHPLLVGISVAVVAALLAYVLKNSSATPLATNENIGNSNKVNIGGNNSGQVAGGNIYNSIATTQTIAEWQPPMLPAGCKLVTVTSAGGTIRNPVTWRDWDIIGPNGGVLIIPGFQSSFSAHVVSNKFYVNADVTIDGINSYSISNLAFHGTMPANWDRNFNSNAFEIVGPDQLPVFQEIYALPEHIIVNGIFPKKPGIIIGMFEDRMRIGFPDEVLTNLPNRNPIFKYPSWKYQGVLAD